MLRGGRGKDGLGIWPFRRVWGESTGMFKRRFLFDHIFEEWEPRLRDFLITIFASVTLRGDSE